MPVYEVPVTLTHPEGSPPSYNIWSLRTVTPGVADELNQGMAELRIFYAAILSKLQQGTTVTFPRLVVNREDDTEQAITEQASMSTTQNGVAPPQLAYCINWSTTTRGRHARGRTFVGPLAATQLNNGIPAIVQASDVLTAAQALVSASMIDNGWAFGVWGKQVKGIEGPRVHRDFIRATMRTDRFATLASRRKD